MTIDITPVLPQPQLSRQCNERLWSFRVGNKPPRRGPECLLASLPSIPFGCPWSPPHVLPSSPSHRSVQCGLLVPRDLVYCVFTRYRESEPQPSKFSPPGHPGTFCACPWPLRLLSSALVLSDASSARNCLSHLPRGSSVPSFSGHFILPHILAGLSLPAWFRFVGSAEGPEPMPRSCQINTVSSTYSQVLHHAFRRSI